MWYGWNTRTFFWIAVVGFLRLYWARRLYWLSSALSGGYLNAVIDALAVQAEPGPKGVNLLYAGV